MKALIVYDSFFGNTEQIARAIAEGFAEGDDVSVVKVGEVTKEQLHGLDVLIVGSPTRAFRPSPETVAFLRGLPGGSLSAVRVAAFDTRMAVEDIDSSFLHFMVNLFGFAAKPVADRLKKKGGQPLLAPEGFIVQGEKGPLKEGELERASGWVKTAL